MIAKNSSPVPTATLRDGSCVLSHPNNTESRAVVELPQVGVHSLSHRCPHSGSPEFWVPIGAGVPGLCCVGPLGSVDLEPGRVRSCAFGGTTSAFPASLQLLPAMRPRGKSSAP